MKLLLYEQIVDRLSSRSCDGSTKYILLVQKDFPNIAIETLRSIYSQIIQTKTKRILINHQKPQTVKEYAKRYDDRVKTNEENVLLHMAKGVGISPALMARIILEYKLQLKANREEEPHKVTKLEVTRLIKEPYLIDDGALAIHIQLCCLQDPCYGPYVDSIKYSIGVEKEFLLTSKLKNLGFDFLSEEDMRKKGYDKTPDIKLEVPFAWNGLIVNWIESKASFGEERSHNQYLKDQYFSYINRFGSGLVIYWFGFIEELQGDCKPHGIILTDHFPEEKDIVRLDPYPLDWDPGDVS